jgi:UDP-N-acetylglucosamine 2-epimerase (non-hydrolysing)
VLLIEPQDYRPFVYLMTQAHLIITEAERLLDDPAAYQAMARALNPYGDGLAAKRILASIQAEAGNG